MKHILIGSLILSSLALPTLAQTQNLSTHSKTVKATVYSQQAMLTREVILKELKKGNYEVKIVDLPLSLNKDSLSVTGEGTAGALIHHVELIPLKKQAKSPQETKLLKAIENIDLQLKKLSNQKEVQDTRADFLETVEAVSEEKIRKQLAYYQIKIKDWKALSAFLASEKGSILDKNTVLTFHKKHLFQKRSELKQGLKEIRSKHRQKKQAALVYLTVERPGQLALKLNYLMHQVSWRPAYEAKLDEKNEKLRLTLLGDLSQRTGEDWLNTTLRLSTANPFINISQPSLNPWYIQAPRYNKGLKRKAKKSKGYRRQRLAANQSQLNMVQDQVMNNLDADIEPVRKKDINYAQSKIETKGVSVVFKIPQKVNVPSTNNSRRVAIASRFFKYKIEYDVIPKRSPYAFLKVRFKNDSGLPLLRGKMRQYVDADYTGSTPFKLVRPNEEAKLNFGVDQDIKVKYKKLTSKKKTTGMLGDIQQHYRGYQFEITNYKSKAKKFNVYEFLPLSKNPKIKVKLLKAEPAPSKKMEKGRLKWVTMIQPWEKKVFKVEYVVEAPKGMALYF